MEARINQIKNTENMRRVASYKGRKFTNLELKDALIDAQNSMMGATFEKTHAENLGRQDFYNYYFNAGKEYGLVEDERYKKFLDELKITKNTIGTLIAGEIGERRVANALRLIEMDGAKVLYNVELQAGEYDRTEIDCVVIDANGIHVLEVKNYRNSIEITSSGELIEEQCEHTYPLGAKLGEKEFLIKKVLSDTGIDSNIPFESVLVIADNQTMVNDNYHFVPICYVGNIVPHLRNHATEFLSREKIVQITEILTNAHVEVKYECSQINFEELVNDFAYAMATIEDKSKARSQEADINSEEIVEDSAETIELNHVVVKCAISALAGAAFTAIGFAVFHSFL